MKSNHDDSVNFRSQQAYFYAIKGADWHQHTGFLGVTIINTTITTNMFFHTQLAR
jgi:hypothetical protein